MWRFPVAVFYGCSHKRTTLPMTLLRCGENGESSPRTYVTCLTCGEELAYNWDKMRTEGRLAREIPAHKPAPGAVWPVPVPHPAAATHAASIGGWQSKAER
jgi:hypothetical protein